MADVMALIQSPESTAAEQKVNTSTRQREFQRASNHTDPEKHCQVKEKRQEIDRLIAEGCTELQATSRHYV